MTNPRSYGPLLAEAGALVREWSRQSEVVVLAPSRPAADEFVRSQAGDGLLGVHRFTLHQFAAEIARSALADRGLAMVTQLGSEALAARSVHEVDRGGLLGYFRPVAHTPGFAPLLARTLLELRSQGVTPADLERAGKPGADLSRLLWFYSNELASRSLADLPLLFEFAEESVDEPHRLLGLPVVCLDLDVQYRCEERFLASLLKRAGQSLRTSLGPGSTDRPESSLAAARRWVFSLDRPTAREPDGSVEFFSAAGEEMECVEIARRTLELARHGTPFDHVAIALRDPKRYQILVEEALRRAAIPAHFSHGANRPDPAGRAFLALLACAAEGCSASRFAEYLSLTPISAPPNWEKLLVDAAVIGGLDRWKRRLKGLEEELRLQLEEGPEEANDERLKSRIEQLASLADFALPIVEQLSNLPKRAHWGPWLAALNDLAESALRRPDAVLSVLGELAAMDEVGPVELEEVYGVLEERLRFFRAEPEARRYGKVFICSIEELRARQFPVVFLPGLAEGMFPRRATENPLLLDRYRIALNMGLALRDDLVASERRLLTTALASAESKIVVSFPSMDTSLSRPRVPSFYALEIVRAVEGKLPDLAAFKTRTAAAAHTRLSWPAPKDPAVAIDDAEYDLASIKRQRGGARYLLEVNSHLKRSLRWRWKRWEKGWSDADGLVMLDQKAKDVLRLHRLTAKPYSPSALQQFAQCPYRFALQAIYGLRPREEAVAIEELDPLTRGALFHRVQFEIFRGGVVTLEALEIALTKVAAEYAEKLAPAVERVWRTAIEDLRTDLRGWLRDVTEHESDWTPERFEYAFGLKPDREGAHDPASTPEAATILEGYRVRGSMDLVERHRTTHALRVVDHKTGKPPDKLPLSVGGGRILQPLIYALAGESLWGQPVESGRLFYCTHRGGYRRIDIEVTENGVGRLRSALSTIDRAIEGGFLPAAPEEGACGQCDYRAVCGPDEEERVTRKDEEWLEPLGTLRGLP